MDSHITLVGVKKAGNAGMGDLLNCSAIAAGSPEYFGAMAGMMKDFHRSHLRSAQGKTAGLSFQRGGFTAASAATSKKRKK